MEMFADSDFIARVGYRTAATILTVEAATRKARRTGWEGDMGEGLGRSFCTARSGKARCAGAEITGARTSTRRSGFLLAHHARDGRISLTRWTEMRGSLYTDSSVT